ncbi:MAG: mechanosensitive ion channel family protein [Gammaproteobacteria bacterium]|nr:mechanosensitive ion channel family protein [Gammaproteobacteria bacterium]
MDINRYLQESFAFLSLSQDWLLQVFLVIVAVLFFNFFQRRFLRRLRVQLEKTQNSWDDAFVVALGPPLTLLIWIIGLAFAAHIVQTATGAEIFTAFSTARDVGVIGCLSWFLVRFTNKVESNILALAERRGRKIDPTTADAITKLLRISIIITATLVVLQTMGFSVSGVMAFGGIGGIAVGFAAKDLLANFFGGLMIYLDRPFATGDWIRSPDREIEGTVENIGWRLTTVRTFDKRPIYIPNSIFANITVENPSRMTHRRIYETIGIRYEDASKMQTIIDDIKAMLLAHDEIDTTQTMIVNFNDYGASSLDFFVYTFTKTTNWVKFHEIKQDVLLKIYEVICSHGADIAFPTTTINTSESAPLGLNTIEREKV